MHFSTYKNNPHQTTKSYGYHIVVKRKSYKEEAYLDNQQITSDDLMSASNLAVLGSVITLLGDTISSYAAVLAVEEEKNATIQQQQYQDNQMELLHSMQEQITDLAEEISILKST